MDAELKELFKTQSRIPRPMTIYDKNFLEVIKAKQVSPGPLVNLAGRHNRNETSRDDA